MQIKTYFFHIATSGTGLACYTEYQLRVNPTFLMYVWIEVVICKLWYPYCALWVLLGIFFPYCFFWNNFQTNSNITQISLMSMCACRTTSEKKN